MLNNRWLQMVTVLIGAMILASVAAPAQVPIPKGIIPIPPEPEGLTVQIWVDKGTYSVGEPITVHYSVNKEAHVYIWDILPNGTTKEIHQDYVEAGKHAFQGTVEPPLGTEYLQILATTPQVDPFSFMSEDPEEFRLKLENKILGILPVSERTWNFTSFKIVGGIPPFYGTVNLSSTPSGAQITTNGRYMGYTPRTLHLQQGYHQIALYKNGYQPWQCGVFIVGGQTRTINARLTSIAPANRPPTAAFNFSPPSPGLSEWIRFDGTGSHDTDGNITNYRWTLGDGSPTRGGSVIYHRFTSAGGYSVSLTVTDDAGATDTRRKTVTVGPVSRPPQASFNYSPINPGMGQQILLDASPSFDPDGTIVAYEWDLDNDGTTDASGQVTGVRYYRPGSHQVRLTVVDNSGLSSTTIKAINIGGGWIPTGPAMGGIPGIFVWGRDKWHVTVNSDSMWSSPHSYRLELRTDGSFQDISRSTSEGITPKGITPSDRKTIIFDGNLMNGYVDYTFTVYDSKSIFMSLRLDSDGDGDLEESTQSIYLLGSMAHPPNVPFVVGFREEKSAPLLPQTNLWIGIPIRYEVSGPMKWVGILWRGQIENL
ncbi:MAG: PKD domain-containing protein [Candidatus Bipolaricaulota bacterium]|nr:PKD domain-containing protein [Candidatus Bipolaricaulota bacterium]